MTTPADRGNPKLYELIEHSPKEGKSPTIWAWPQIIDYLKVAGQPVQGPWPPHQESRPDPTDETLPVAVPDRQSSQRGRTGVGGPSAAPSETREPRRGSAPY